MVMLHPSDARARLLTDGELAWVYGPRRHELATVRIDTEDSLKLGDVVLRDVPRSPDAGVIADYHGSFDDPAALATHLSATPGVVEHGLFPPDMVAAVIIARGSDLEHRELRS